MKNVMIFFSLMAVLAFSSCKECDSEDPRARIVNDGTESVSVQIQTSGGNTININNILQDESSEFQTYAPGIVAFTITVGNGGNTTIHETTVVMEECFEYDIQVDSNNQITTVPRDRNG